MNKQIFWPLSLAVILGTTSLNNLPIQAQSMLTDNQENQLIKVDPENGDDQRGNGSESRPFKTITQALMLAKNGTTIKLASGTYNEESGENFPLIFNKNIILEGDSSNKGKDVIIKGNGAYISPTSAGQYVTIVALEKANRISGVTVINPHNQGYGIWIESANLNISHNSFLNSGNGGVSVNGESAPLISENYFYNIQGNGLVVYGESRPQVSNNEFINTGFGISVLQNSTVILRGNKISQNRIGVILENNSQAILRENIIEFSEEDGIVALRNSWVNLGKKDEPGKNIFGGNKGVDIRNLTKDQTIPAFDNKFSSSTVGKIDLTGSSERVELMTDNNRPLLTLNSTSSVNSINITEPLPGLQSVSLPPEKMSLTSVNPPPSPPSPPSPPPIVNNGNGTLPPPPSINAIPNHSSGSSSVNNSTGAISIPVVINNNSTNPTPPPVTNPTPNVSSNRRGLEELITVNPNFNNGKNQQPTFRNDVVVVPNTDVDLVQPIPQVTVYRVLVDPLNSRQEQELKRLYPRAFATTYNGQSLWQVGSYQDKRNAEQELDKLNQIGISGLIVR
jgi:parallel beta-helix repeat protein